jgi:hypothetical protein
MDEKDQAADGKATSENGGSRKKTYEKPAFRFERVFETMALACGKVGVLAFNCRFNRKSS